MFLDNFINRCVCITICVLVVLYCFFPRYEFLDKGHRADRISGKVESYSHEFYNKGWHE